MKRKDSIFTSVPSNRVPRNYFDLSHEVKMSGKFGYLYPMLCVDVLPGDSFRDQVSVFLRCAPMLAPMMHRCDVTTHFFFVPNRLLTDGWEEFITGGQDGTETYVLPYITPAGLAAAYGNGGHMRTGQLWDYLGLPVIEGADPGTFSTEQISVLPFRAYAKIYNDFYIDPNLGAEIPLNTNVAGDVSSASNSATLFHLRKHMWQKDYFTASLPWAQRGSEVLMPISASGYVTYIAQNSVWHDGSASADGNIKSVGGQLKDSTGAYASIHNIDDVVVDQSAVSINDFRKSLAIQRWLENNARGGHRYIEQIESHFNTRVPDFRLQRAEYLGGGKQPITISEVLSTADTTDVPVGDMAGHGVSVGKSNRFTYRAQEHGWIIGIVTVGPQSAYQQGLDKRWTRKDKYDFAWPELAHIGEQETLSKEVFYSFDNADAAANDTIFGYIPRYSDYKFQNDRVSGDFRDTLAFWHLGRIFTSRPTLDKEFTEMDEYGATAQEESMRRIFAVQDGTDYLWMQLFHRMSAKRPLPYFGVPKIVG